MVDTAIAITAGTGTNVDTRTESTNGHHRQVIIIGDPSENNSVLGVNASQGIKVYSETAQAVTNASLDNIDVLLSTRLASGSTLPITNSYLDAPLSNLLASGSTLPITNAYLPNLDVPLSTRLASGSTLPITNVFLDTPLSTRLASGSTLPITNTYLQNIDVLLSTRLASGSTLPITNAFLDVPLSTRLASGSTLPITGSVGLLAGTNYVGKTRLTDGTTDAEVIPLTGYNAQAVGIVDGDGNQVTSFGGGVQYQEGYSSSGSSLTGTVSMWEDGNSLIRPASTSLPFPINNVGNSIGLLQSGSTLPITNSYLQNIDVLLSSRLASGSTLPVTNAFWDVPLSTRHASGSTLPITNAFLDVALSTRLASGSTLPITNRFLDVALSTRLASGSTLPITGKVTGMGYYNPSLASFLSGTTNALMTDVNGNLNVTMNTQWRNAWFSASGTNTIFKSTGGMLHLVTIEMQSSPTLTIYDNASGVSGSLLVNLNANAPMGNYLQDIYFTGGISAQLHAGVAPSIKISYR